MEQTSAAPPAAAPVPLRFTGMAGEYFRIWIVNLCLSVLTLGIYSAWAKVRRKRYFYGNTLLERRLRSSTSGNPVAISRAALIVFAIFGAYALLKEVHFLFAIALFAAIAAALPWVIQRALQFNARNSTHRNVRFGFKRHEDWTSSACC